MGKAAGRRVFGYQPPKDYSESKYPYFGKLMTHAELVEGWSKLKIDKHLERERNRNGWHRYVEAQIWAEPEEIQKKYRHSVEVTPESWTMGDVTYLQNYKELNK